MSQGQANNLSYSVDSSGNMTISGTHIYSDGTIAAYNDTVSYAQYLVHQAIVNKLWADSVLYYGIATPRYTPTLTQASGTQAAGVYNVGFSLTGPSGETALSPLAQITLTTGHGIQVTFPNYIIPSANVSALNIYCSTVHDGTIMGFVSSTAIVGVGPVGAITFDGVGNTTAPKATNQNITYFDVARHIAIFKVGYNWMGPAATATTISGSGTAGNIST